MVFCVSVGAAITANAKSQSMFLGGRFLTGGFSDNSLQYLVVCLSLKQKRTWFLVRWCFCEKLSCGTITPTVTGSLPRFLQFLVSRMLVVNMRVFNCPDFS